MLKAKTQNNEIVAIKLTSGDEIITRLVNVEDGFHKVNRPLAMVMAEDPNNPTQTRVMFTPWMVAAEDGVVSINSDHVIAMTKARDDAAIQYEQAIA